MTKPKAGVIGLGVMGSAMSGNLIAAGFEVVGYDVNPERQSAHVAAGGTAASSPVDVADRVDTLITSLPTTAALEAVVSGADGLIHTTTKNLVVIEMSTFPLDAKLWARDTLAEVGVTTLDCPPSGTGAQARVKDLVIYVSGDERAAERVTAIIDGFSRLHFYTGEYGNGSKFKYIANLLVAIHNVSTAEAILLGKRAGLDVDLMLRVVGGGAGTSKMFEVRGPLMPKAATTTPRCVSTYFTKTSRSFVASRTTSIAPPRCSRQAPSCTRLRRRRDARRKIPRAYWPCWNNSPRTTRTTDSGPGSHRQAHHGEIRPGANMLG